MLGTQELFKQSCAALPEHVAIEADGVPVTVPEGSEGIVATNIDSYSGDVQMWAGGGEEQKMATDCDFLGFSREPQGGALFFSEEQLVPDGGEVDGRPLASLDAMTRMVQLGRAHCSCVGRDIGDGRGRGIPEGGTSAESPAKSIPPARCFLRSRSTSAGGVGLSAEMGKALEAILAKLRPIQTAIQREEEGGGDGGEDEGRKKQARNRM